MDERVSQVINAMNTKQTIFAITVSAAAACVALAAGCDSQKPAPAGGPQAEQASGLFPHVHKTGAQIWAENCTRCHYARPANQYSAQQWDIITSHMRDRADLTGEEQRAVYHFMTGT